MSPRLFEPYSLRGLTLDNRIVLSPMCQYAARDGNASDWHVMHLGQYACANIGIVITEATGVEPRGRISPWCLGLYSDENQEALARVLAFTRNFGSAKFGVQLSHAGRKSSVPAAFENRLPLPPEKGGWTPLAPSAYLDDSYPPPHAMTLEDIEDVKASFAQATRRAAEIGVDLIELHFAHGYLVSEFLSTFVNQRTDDYGGSRENRMRFALEVFDVCRSAFPQDRPIGARISAIDWVAGGWSIEDSCALAAELKARGCDYICASSGGVVKEQQVVAGPGYQVPFAEAVRRETGITTMAVGQVWEPQQAEDVLQAGQADLIAIGRRLLANPHWSWMAAAHFKHELKYPPRYRSVQPRFAEEPAAQSGSTMRMYNKPLETSTKSWGS